MRILMVCAEFAPLAKVGGLGDVTAGLAAYLRSRGHDVAVVMPYYGVIEAQGAPLRTVAIGAPRPYRVGDSQVHYAVHRITDSGAGPMVYLVDCPALFGDGVYDEGAREAARFLLLSRAALETATALAFEVDILHCHDWHTSPAVVLLKGPFRGERALREAYAVLTIHNIGYQGVFDAGVLVGSEIAAMRSVFTRQGAVGGDVNFLRAGIACADALTTVSPTHAREIQTPQYGMGLDELLRQRRHRLVGILNGVDYGRWDPRTDTLLPAPYSLADLAGKRASRSALLARLGLDAADEVPIVGLVARLTSQKGIDVVMHALPALFARRPLVCAFLGSGESRYVEGLAALAARFPRRLAHVDAYDETLAHLIYAGSDMLLVPSLYEPCGLTQMYAMRYGTVPVVRHTGGLADTVEHFDPATGQGTGSVFRDADVGGLSWGLGTALDWFADKRAWGQVMRNAMRRDFSWDRQGPRYEELFRRLAGGSG
jgi:starch synthase